MVIAGLCGGLDGPDENRFGVAHYASHDAACVLLEDGDVTVAIEAERLNRIKHTNKCPFPALRFCLDQRGLAIDDVDAFAFGVRESYLDGVMAHRYALAPTVGLQRGRQGIQRLIEDEFGVRLDPRRFHFVDHHFAHACSAYYPSGFDRALIFTTDGVGDSLSGSIYRAAGGRLELLHTFPEEESLGFFYLHVTRYLGFDLFDEYKVMGLAPYGDGERFARVFRELYALLPEGRYRFDRERMRDLWQRLPARAPGETPTQSDKDVAMAAQLTLQRIVEHVLTHYRQATGLEDLCLAGGVALNCRMNGELLARGMFRRIFVQPAAHDGGLSLGAALHVHQQSLEAPAVRSQMRHVYWGGHCGADRVIETLLGTWDAFVDYERVSDPYTTAARLMHEGAIIGWMRGRSEFGPRALGNRSILADPRPAANKDVINALVKKREAFRPFAPTVLEEYAGEFFELPAGCESFPFMLFTVQVRARYRETLGAITHVDGSARLQTVSRRDNACYWRLIDAFRELTGVPILLNTSFNNFAEPIVETASDGLICFLTTGLPVLMIENWIVRKKPRSPDALCQLRPRLPVYTKLHEVSPAAQLFGGGTPPDEAAKVSWWRSLRARVSSRWRAADTDADAAADADAAEAPRGVIGNTFDQRQYTVSNEVFSLLLACDGHRPLGELMDGVSMDAGVRRASLQAIEELWERRLVMLNPLQ